MQSLLAVISLRNLWVSPGKLSGGVPPQRAGVFTLAYQARWPTLLVSLRNPWDPPFQGFLPLRQFPAASVPRAHSTSCLRIAFALHDGFDHALSAFAPHIRDHACQFDSGRIQDGCRSRLMCWVC